MSNIRIAVIFFLIALLIAINIPKMIFFDCSLFFMTRYMLRMIGIIAPPAFMPTSQLPYVKRWIFAKLIPIYSSTIPDPYQCLRSFSSSLAQSKRGSTGLIVC